MTLRIASRPAVDPLPRAAGISLALWTCLTMTLVGCVTPWERSALLGGRDTKIDGVQGPTERRLRNTLRREKQQELADESDSLKPLAGTDDYLTAEELYEAGKYAEAQEVFKELSRKTQAPRTVAWNVVTLQWDEIKAPPTTEIREDALFMQAECAYHREHYAKAQDLYSELLKDYPSTRHLDEVSKRLFEVARIWLDFPEAAAVGEVQQVNYDDFGRKLPAEEPRKKPKHSAVAPNFTDKKRPLFDPQGNAVGALRLIWLNDPTGPLADDALMMVASHYARKGDFVEADRHYTLLREEYPNSQHVETAFVLGSHVKLMAYQGAAYEGKTLEDAEHLKESMLRLYPELEDRGRIEDELKRIAEAKAAREWQLVEFYANKRNKRAQAVYCHILLQKFPQTSYAPKARERLQQLGPDFANGAVLLTAEPDPPRPWYALNGPQASPALAGQRRNAERQQQELRERYGRIIRRPPNGEAKEAELPQEPAEPEPDTEVTDKTPPPRSRWWSRGSSKPDEEPIEPGDEIEEEPTEREPRKGLFRFTPPKRLFNDDKAKPVDDEAEPETTDAE